MLGSISPTAAEAESAATTLTVTGSGFVEQSSVSWNGGSRPTSFVAPSRLTATIPASDLVSVVSHRERVEPGGYLLSMRDRLITSWGSDRWTLDLPASPN